MIICKACDETMESHRDFDTHNCPATPKPRKGEPWEAYKARAEQYAREWRARPAPTT